MSKFRIPAPPSPKPESPALLFRDLKRHPSVKFLWGHQEKLLDSYQEQEAKHTDIAIELPTGAGKTLVGLLIAEYRRRSKGHRVAFLCPTKQLCAQVNEHAKRYGIGTSLLTGSQKYYDQTAFSDYQRAKKIAITTYSGLFNVGPRINDPETVICDDAHAADGYVSNLWSVQITRSARPELFEELFRALQSALPEYMSHLIQTRVSPFWS